MSEPRSARVVFVEPFRCLVRFPLVAGEVRRRGHPSSPRAALAYDLACPSCGTRNTWLAGMTREPAIVEGPLVQVRPPVDDEEDRREDRRLAVWDAPSTITTERAKPCAGCNRTLTIVEGLISAA